MLVSFNSLLRDQLDMLSMAGNLLSKVFQFSLARSGCLKNWLGEEQSLVFQFSLARSGEGQQIRQESRAGGFQFSLARSV